MGFGFFAPILCFLLIFILILLSYDDKAEKIRDAFIYAAVVWGVLIVISTEVLSALEEISFKGVFLFWFMASLFVLFLLYAFQRGKRRTLILTEKPISISVKTIISIIAIFVFLEGLVALIAPPTNWDAMTYHMSRVVHWIQNRSLDFYSTSILRQDYQMPWAEYVILHFQVLSGGDYLANLVQWFSMLGSVVGVSLIARELGADTLVQTLAALVAVTTPMGILQASSAQNDFVVSFWLVCLVYFLLRMRRQLAWKDAIATGAVLGLALFTKGTGYIYAFPFLAVWFLAWVVRRRSDFILLFKLALLIGALGLTIPSPHLIRNTSLFGSPLGPGADYQNFNNDELTLPIVFANVVRNVGLHLGTPWNEVNTFIQRSIKKMLGKEINNPSSTWGGEIFNVGFSFHEDLTGNPIHLLLWGLSAILVLVNRKIREDRNLLVYSLTLAWAFLLFSMALRWQPWHSRLHLPLFILAAPAVAITFARIMSRNQLLVTAFILSGLSSPWLFSNASRPLIGSNSIFVKPREVQYFVNRPWIEEAYRGAADSACQMSSHNIGLVLGPNDWEYPLWVLLYKECPGRFHVEHVNVTNISRGLADQDFSPEVIIATQTDMEIQWSSITFREVWSTPGVGVYIP
jgi:hypothetical protein